MADPLFMLLASAALVVLVLAATALARRVRRLERRLDAVCKGELPNELVDRVTALDQRARASTKKLTDAVEREKPHH